MTSLEEFPFELASKERKKRKNNLIWAQKKSPLRRQQAERERELHFFT